MRSRGPWNTAQKAHEGAKLHPLLNAKDLGIRTIRVEIGVACVYKRSFLGTRLNCKGAVCCLKSCRAGAICREDGHPVWGIQRCGAYGTPRHASALWLLTPLPGGPSMSRGEASPPSWSCPMQTMAGCWLRLELRAGVSSTICWPFRATRCHCRGPRPRRATSRSDVADRDGLGDV